MKDEWRLFAGGAVIVGATAGLYWFITYEHAGSVMLALCGGALALVAGWLYLQARRLDGPRPEDRDAEPIAWHGLDQSLVLDLPPLTVVWLTWNP